MELEGEFAGGVVDAAWLKWVQQTGSPDNIEGTTCHPSLADRLIATRLQ